jgi:hypothetical protein
MNKQSHLSVVVTMVNSSYFNSALLRAASLLAFFIFIHLAPPASAEDVVNT